MENGVRAEAPVIPDDIHDFMLWRNWFKVIGATADYLERVFMRGSASSQQP